MPSPTRSLRRSPVAPGAKTALLLATALVLAACQSLQPPASEEPATTAVAPTVIDRPQPRKPRSTPAPVEVISEEPEAPAHLLARMIDGFGFEVDDHERVGQQVSWFTRNPDFLERVFTRGSLYLPHILDEIENRGLPTELALIPLIESAYDPFAYSHGRAAGLWQFIPGTGQRFGLRQNWWYDGRRDVVESTRAALDYFEYLHGFFDGDWLLAMAAYNAGEGRVRQAVRRNQGAARDTDFWNLPLPRETRHYVPRLLAIRAVLSDPEAYEVALPEIEDVPGFAIVPVEGQLDLALAAELAGVSTDEIYQLNPGFNRWATDPEGPQRLLVPADREEAFIEGLAGIDTHEQVQWSRHRIVAGDSLIAIARRYGTTVEVIRSVNDLQGNAIRAGNHLMVPRAVQSLDRYPGSAEVRLAATQATPRGNVRREHVVGAGESLWTISRRYGVSVRELATWNGMAPRDTLRTGRTLVVWQQGAGAGAGASATASNTQVMPAEAARLRQVNYTVRSGDSLWRIANRFSVSVDELVQWNNLVRNATLRPGQRLVVHVDVTRQSS